MSRSCTPRSPRCSTTPNGGPGWAPRAVGACSSGSAGRRSRPPPRRPTSGPSVLTVDFDRLGVRPGDRALDMGCGAGRHTFELYRRGADVVAFDQDADELAT